MTVLTLDAGGTNFVFSAIKNGKFFGEPIKRTSNGDKLDLCLLGIIDGFKTLQSTIDEKISAISFAFPGPADYRNGIIGIGDLSNFKCFQNTKETGGVPLKAMLENIFKVPVFINNDGDLYTYGEACAGTLPYINAELKKNENPKRYKNLVGLSIGTGFGAGIVSDKTLILGDNLCAGEIWRTSNRLNPEENNEELISIRAARRYYAEFTKTDYESTPTPEDIYNIGIGKMKGNKKAAQQAFFKIGEYLGDAIANLVMMFDGIIAIGGGVAGAKELIIPGIEKELKHNFSKSLRVTQSVYCLNKKNDFEEFLKSHGRTVRVPLSNEEIYYTDIAKCGYIFSPFNTSKMVSIGAYFYAKETLEANNM